MMHLEAKASPGNVDLSARVTLSYAEDDLPGLIYKSMTIYEEEAPAVLDAMVKAFGPEVIQVTLEKLRLMELYREYDKPKALLAIETPTEEAKNKFTNADAERLNELPLPFSFGYEEITEKDFATLEKLVSEYPLDESGILKREPKKIPETPQAQPSQPESWRDRSPLL